AAELEFRGDDNWLVQVGRPVGEAEVVAVADLDLASRIQDGGTPHELADGALAAFRIATQGTPHGAWYSGQDLEAGQACPGRLRDQGRERHCGARRDGILH